MSEYTEQAENFLKKAKATCEITYGGKAFNPNWKDKEPRNFYNVVLSSPKGIMPLQFWDSINNTQTSEMTKEAYAKKRFKCEYQYLTDGDKRKVRKELSQKKAEAKPTAYDVLACVTKYDPGTFKEFCMDYGYDDDSITAYKTYVAVTEEYKNLERVFTREQLKELEEIQ